MVGVAFVCVGMGEIVGSDRAGTVGAGLSIRSSCEQRNSGEDHRLALGSRFGLRFSWADSLFTHVCANQPARRPISPVRARAKGLEDGLLSVGAGSRGVR